MNWMGGVRNRLKVKNERKRQQDFFEKKKFSSKVRKLETNTNPSKKKQAVSLDLLSLQAANFSAAHFKKNGTGIRSGGRINRVDLDKSRGLFKQKFVDLPDASPDTKPSALNLSKPSPQESASCPKPYPTSRIHTLSTITEDKSPSVADISSQDLSLMLTQQKEQSHFWTSTPADFWHKKERPAGNNSILDLKQPFAQVDDHDTVKKEPSIHSPSTSEKLLLDGSRVQMRTMDDGDYWAGKTPGSSTSGWSDLSTVMEDTDEATVPSVDDDDLDYHAEWSNQVSSQSFSESVQSRDVPSSQSTLPTAGEESLLIAPDSTLSSFKDCHKMEYSIGDSQMGDSNRPVHQFTSGEQYSRSHEIELESQVENQLYSEHIATNCQPANTLHADKVVDMGAFSMDPAVPRDLVIAKKVRKRVQLVDQQKSRKLNEDTVHQTSGQAQHGSLLHQYVDMMGQRDLVCHESTSFTSPEDCSTYLMTERAKMDNYRQHPGLQDSRADTSWQYPTLHSTKQIEEDINAVRGHASTKESKSVVYSRNNYHGQIKDMHVDPAISRKFTRGQRSGHQDTNVDVMNLYSCQKRRIYPVEDERREDMMQAHPFSKQPSSTQVQEKGGPSMIGNQDDDKYPIDIDNDDKVNDKDDFESSESTECSSPEDSPDMDLAPDINASSINNWLDFVHADVSGVNRTETERKATKLLGDARSVKTVKDLPATAQQMLEEVLALDRQLHKETLAADIVNVSERTHVFVGVKERAVEYMSDNSSQSHTEDTLQEVHDITSPVQELKTLLQSHSRNTKPEDTGKEQVHEAHSIDMKGRHGRDVEDGLSANVSSSQTEEKVATVPQNKSAFNMTRTMFDDGKSFAYETSSSQKDLTTKIDAVSTTVAVIGEELCKTPSSVSTSTSAGTVADYKTQGEKFLCESSVQCTLIGDPLPMPLPMSQGRGSLEVTDSCIQSSDITMASLDIMKESSACDSITDTLSSQENDFESCVSTP